MPKDYGEVKRSAEDRVAWRAITRQSSILKKMTHDDDDDYCIVGILLKLLPIHVRVLVGRLGTSTVRIRQNQNCTQGLYRVRPSFSFTRRLNV